MKQIFLVILLSTMLFSASRQIILGSYMEERNAIEGVQKLQEHIEDSDKLSWLKKTNVIEAKYKKVGKYFVVYLTPIENKNQLFRAYSALERYYTDAYVIDYLPNDESSSMQLSSEKIIPQKIKVNNKKEMLIAKDEVTKPKKKVKTEVIEPKKKAEIEVVEDEDEYASDEDMQRIKDEIEIVEEIESPEIEEMALKDDIEIISEAKEPKKEKSIKQNKTSKIKEKVSSSEKNYFLEILLVVLVLLGIVYIIYKNKRKKGDEIQEIHLEEK